MKILIAEDDLYSRRYLEDLLLLEKYECLAAKNGEEALQLYKTNEIDIIISDIQMPKLSGLELLEEIRKERNDVIVIMTTAYGSEEFAIKALQLGANNYLKKPINIEQLLQLLIKYQKVLAQPRIDFKVYGKIKTKHLKIEFENKFESISEIVQKLMYEMVANFDETENINIELGLLEIITNAIEHGNLEITYYEKQKALDNNTLEQLYNERFANPQLANRKVQIEYNLNETFCEWIIKDEGNGFDYNNLPDPTKDNLLELNGRGIFISKFLFDELEYQGCGNTVRLKKYLK